MFVCALVNKLILTLKTSHLNRCGTLNICPTCKKGLNHALHGGFFGYAISDESNSLIHPFFILFNGGSILHPKPFRFFFIELVTPSALT